MKKILYLSLAAVTLALGGCSNEDDFGGQSAVLGNDVISAVAPSKDTRTSMNGKSVLWDEGDVIGVISTKAEADDNNTPYTLSGGAGSATGQFSGMSESGYKKVAAYYPYNNTVTYSSADGMSLTLPASYVYRENSNNNAPMACLIEENAQGNISFKHAGALMYIVLEKIPANCNTIKLTSANSDSKLTGAAKITFENGTPTLAIADNGSTQAATNTGGDTSAEGHTITITFDNNGVDKTTKSFYFPIPVANYSALTLSVEGTGNFTTQTIKSKALNATRGYRYTSTLAFDEMSGLLPTEVDSAEEIKEALAQTNAVVVPVLTDISSGSTSKAPEIVLPKVEDTAVAAESVSIAFGKVSTESTITIKEDNNASGDTGETKAVAKAVTIAVPPVAESGTDGSKAPKVEVNLPNSTVTLAVANGQTTTFAEVTASTAEETLVVEDGVTITKLTVKKGNIRLKGKAKITELIKDNSYQGTVKIIVEGTSYSLPDNLSTSDFEVIDGVADDLNKVAAKGGTYTLPANVTGDFIISATTEPVVIDLNGYTITNKSEDTFTVNIGSTLTIKGNGTVDNVTNGKACIYNNGTVVLNGGEYTRSKEAGTFTPTNSANGNSYYNILNHGVMTIYPGVNVHANGSHSSLIASGYKSYSDANPRNGHVSGTNHAEPSLTIKGGTFSGGIITVKNDDGAKLTIEDGTFSNETQSAVQNNHWAEIKGGSFNPEQTALYSVESKYYDGGHNLGQTIISGGTFNGTLYFYGASSSLTISGGTFSDPHALDYLTAGAKVNVRLLADTKLEKSVVMTKGTATLDLKKYTLTAAADAKVEGTHDKGGNVAIAVKEGATLTVENGSMGNNSDVLFYGIFAFGKCDVILKNVNFSEKVTYAYNGKSPAGTLDATGCTFRGWLSAWFGGGKFTDCTFTIGKQWYPAAICYGNTTFTGCKFFKNDTDADTYNGPDQSDGYYRCDYIVAGCNSTTTIDFKDCKFIDESGAIKDNVTASNHPYHACDEWGDGKPANANVKVDGSEVTTKCSLAAAASK